MNTPTLSIITPVLDGVGQIDRCLDSVRQHAPADHEHLVVDGGSTDGTVERVRAAMARDERVRLLPGPDRGQSHAMNKGVAAARGTILGILNVDDEYLAGGPGLAVAALGTSPAPGFFWGACEVADPRPGHAWIQRPGRIEAWRMLAGWAVAGWPVNPSSYFYHRSLHDVAGPYREDEEYAMDVEFIARAAPHLAAVHRTELVIGRFHLTPGTKTYRFLERPDRHAHLDRLLAPLRRRLPPWQRVKCAVARRCPRLGRLLP